jgi:hypothetical protein
MAAISLPWRRREADPRERATAAVESAVVALNDATRALDGLTAVMAGNWESGRH